MTPEEFAEAVKAQIPELVRYEIGERYPEQPIVGVRFYTAPIPEKGIFYVEVPLLLRVLEAAYVDIYVREAANSVEEAMRHYDVERGEKPCKVL